MENTTFIWFSLKIVSTKQSIVFYLKESNNYTLIDELTILILRIVLGKQFKPIQLPI